MWGRMMSMDQGPQYQKVISFHHARSPFGDQGPVFFTSDFSFLKPLFPQEAQLRIILLLSECTHTDPFWLLQSRKKLMERARIEPGFSFSSSDSSNLSPNTLSRIYKILFRYSAIQMFSIATRILVANIRWSSINNHNLTADWTTDGRKDFAGTEIQTLDS